ncbi:MAG: MDR family MFS transporter [Candidatus Dormibacteria bacterium]
MAEVTVEANTTISHIPWTSQRIRWTAGLMLAMLVAAMDSTIVGTALPTIGAELGHFSLYSWVFSGYLLTATTTVPLWGRLADLYGRKLVLYAGLGIFVGASVLCGSAHSMLALVLFRALQGLGAGCLQPVTTTIVGDLFPLRQRARIQGLFGGMWALAAVSGPLLGALLVSTVGWRWIFIVNVPIGLAAATLLWSFSDRVKGDRVSIDYLGALLLTAGVGFLLFGFGTGGAGSHVQLPLIALAAVVLAAFVVVERRAASPTVPLRFLTDSVIGPALLLSVLGGTLFFGLTSYVPLYVQAGLGGSPTSAGAALSPLTLGWPLAAVVSGRLLIRVGYQRLVLAGTLLILIGTGLLAAPPPIAPVVWVGISTMVIGTGLGTLLSPLLVVLQSMVGWGDRGSVTAMNQFSRTIGGAIGVALLGILLASRISGAAVARGLDPRRMADPLRLSTQTAVGRDLVAQGIHSLNLVYLGIAVVAVVIALLVKQRSGDVRFKS